MYRSCYAPVITQLSESVRRDAARFARAWRRRRDRFLDYEVLGVARVEPGVQNRLLQRYRQWCYIVPRNGARFDRLRQFTSQQLQNFRAEFVRPISA